MRGQVTEFFPWRDRNEQGVQRDRHKGLQSQSYGLFIMESRRHNHASTKLTHGLSESLSTNLPQNLTPDKKSDRLQL